MQEKCNRNKILGNVNRDLGFDLGYILNVVKEVHRSWAVPMFMVHRVRSLASQVHELVGVRERTLRPLRVELSFWQMESTIM